MMAIQVVNKNEAIEARQKLEELRDEISLGTTLVSYYIPAGGSLSSVSQHVTGELGTAANIKSKVTRKGVQGALRSIQQNVKGLRKIPDNGLAIFASSSSYI